MNFTKKVIIEVDMISNDEDLQTNFKNICMKSMPMGIKLSWHNGKARNALFAISSLTIETL